MVYFDLSVTYRFPMFVFILYYGIGIIIFFSTLFLSCMHVVSYSLFIIVEQIKTEIHLYPVLFDDKLKFSTVD